MLLIKCKNPKCSCTYIIAESQLEFPGRLSRSCPGCDQPHQFGNCTTLKDILGDDKENRRTFDLYRIPDDKDLQKALSID